MSEKYKENIKKAVATAIDNQDLYCNGTLYKNTLCEHVMGELGDLDGVKEKFLGEFDFSDILDQPSNILRQREKH